MKTTHLLSFLAAATHGVLADGTTGSSWTYPYPYPVQNHLFTSQRQILAQAYMDIKPNGTANNQTIMLLHGKNFCGATWVGSIQALSAAGYRVIAPDQIGFCKSSKPKGYQFTLSQLAHNTKGILDSLGITKLARPGRLAVTRRAVQQH
jgi:pimeloyl-ACP methyl ester carboxylesterase